ncbi:MAG: beta-propeller fold lactonase family protein, partial [Phycisphaerae bacterium]|nr:beta-propeller fold lactonase family protein [Phycisphaerae bacterium]
ADIHVHPTGKFLYGSNRGHDSIAVFTVDELTGRLTTVGYASTRGKNPRNFAIDPSGRWLLAANQDSNTVVVFSIDPQRGLLTAKDGTLAMPSPVCLRPVVRSR